MGSTELNHDCWVLVFSHISLQEMMPLRVVCGLWQTAIETICRSKRSLKLFRSKARLNNYLHYLYTYPRGSRDFLKFHHAGRDDDFLIKARFFGLVACRPILPLFPNVHVFVCEIGLSMRSYNLIYFLERLPQLTHLCIFGSLTDQFDDSNVSLKLLQAINKLNLLTHLYIHVPNLFHLESNNCKPQVHLSLSRILPRLKHFSFCSSTVPANDPLLQTYFDDIGSVLSRLGPNLTHLTLDSVYITSTQFSIALEANLTFLRFNLINRGYYHSKYNMDLMPLICSHLKSLQSLHINFSRWTNTDIDHSLIITHLAKLEHLTELCLGNMEIRKSDFIALLPQLTSISTLKFTQLYIYPSNATQFVITLARMFPNLRHLALQTRILRNDHSTISVLKKQAKEHFKFLHEKNIDCHHHNEKSVFGVVHFDL